MLSDARYNHLVSEAKRRGWRIGRGPKSQLGQFISWLLDHAQDGETEYEQVGRIREPEQPQP